MPDEIDAAQDYEEQVRQRALAQQAAKTAAETPFEIEGVRVCADCFDAIGKKRLKANPQAVRCLECQLVKERDAKRVA